MTRPLLVSPDRVAIVNLAVGEYWLRLTLKVGHEFKGGDFVRFSPGATVSVEGADELASSYTRANWASGIASGALYAFRTLRIPHQRLFVTELTGRLRACDMDAVANSAAIAIAKLAEKDVSGLTTQGWTVLAQVMEPERSIADRTSSPEPLESTVALGPLSTKRQQELRSMSSAQLYALILRDQVARELLADEVRLIHDIAAARSEAGDSQAHDVVAAANASLS